MNLPKIDILNSPYHVYSNRSRELLRTINCHKDILVAAFFDDDVRYDLDANIRARMAQDKNYSFAKGQMTSPLPDSLHVYAESHGSHLQAAVDADINAIGAKLNEGQIVYHGSVQLPGSILNFTTNRPFSTTLSPKIAIQEIVHDSKAYNAGLYVIYMLEVKNPKTNVFVYPEYGAAVQSGGVFEMDELEILFASGAEINITSTSQYNDAEAFTYPHDTKMVPVYILRGTIS